MKVNNPLKMRLQTFAPANVVENIYNTPVLLDYFKDLERDFTLGDTLFPETKVDDIEVDMIMGGNNLPVSASVHAWDTEAEIGERDGFEIVKMELALIKQKIKMAERDIVKIQNPRTSNELRNVLSNLFNDAENMVNRVRTRTEAMRFEALTTGKLTFNENGFEGILDYGVPDNHREAVAVSWLDPAADPLNDLKKWQSKIQADTGVKPMRALTSERVAGALEDNPKVRVAIFGNNNQVVTREDLNNFLAKKGLPMIAVEDRSYRVRDGKGYATKRFVAEDTFTMFPEGELGQLVYGLTAEEIELQSDGSVDVNKIGNIVTTVYKTNDPVARWTKAVATALPSFPVANQVFIATGLLAEPAAPETGDGENPPAGA